MKRHPVACICGSTSQREAINELNRRLTMDGKIVVAPGVFGHDGDPITDDEKERLDGLHRSKIVLAPEIHFIEKPDGTFGESTSREFEYASSEWMCKKIYRHNADLTTVSMGWCGRGVGHDR